MIRRHPVRAALLGAALSIAFTAQSLAADGANRAERPPLPTTTGAFVAPDARPTGYKCGVYKGGKGQDVTWCGCSGVLDCVALSKLCSGPMMEDGNNPSQGGCIAPGGTPSN